MIVIRSTNYKTMNNKNLSCELTMPVETPQPKTELEQTAESLGITPAKLKSMREYAVILRKSDKRMKESTIRKKILEKYKIKLT